MENTKKYFALNYLCTWDQYRLVECRTFREVSVRLKDYVGMQGGN